MNLSDKIKIKGEVTFKVTDKDGNIKEWSQPNLVTKEGLGFFASKIFDRKSLTYSTVGPLDVVSDSDTVNYYISDIAFGTSDSPAALTDTFYNKNPHGTKIRKAVTDVALNEEDNSFYYQVDLRAIAGDTLGGENAEPIKEVLLIAKSNFIPTATSEDTTFDSPVGSIANPKKLVCRTVLQQPFTKYVTDRVTLSWKIKLG
tara:strand:- start:220 stop:822 length:603 start_codon:yes stop_codon:yes gene_type:complete